MIETIHKNNPYIPTTEEIFNKINTIKNLDLIESVSVYGPFTKEWRLFCKEGKNLLIKYDPNLAPKEIKIRWTYKVQ